MTLQELEPQLYAETVAALEARRFSPAFCVPDVEEARRIVRLLAITPLAERCRCGQSDCRTYRFARLEPSVCGQSIIRFIFPGDFMLFVDDELQPLKLERLTP